ncbi:hypothetical protein DSM106972_049100 [Dulcicalothrix desertica PCC 7102]|uniref:Uncharacterized protein n=1 Tax=Dulcicalothrix desertica PCC 7102 TaxID=232991 RepID=A0A433VD05_9CYAN|nr:hypothetical protein [Dulcicalothrix desertica]RUT03996.1 hypothetical protein DSM106972_049100 [Dulcicalothrix desertica PCC 7102]TWH43598.1 hypothetical protein CAL7102_07335 [Dulcicalothrix desertica PCC 7102]
MKYLLPLSYNEFLLWYRRSELKIMKFRLIPIFDEDFADDTSKLDKVATRVVEAVPNYEEDYEVLIAQVEDIYKVAPYDFDESKLAFINISIHNLKCVYPITERGEKLLQGRIDNSINLAKPIFENYVNAYVQRQQSSLSLLGGAALLKIAKLDVHKYQDTIKLLQDEALSGTSKNSRDEKFPLNGTFLENLLCYSRHDPIPNTNIGYFLDFGVIVSKLYSGKNDVTHLLDDYRSCLKEITSKNKNKNVKFDYLLKKTDDIISSFDTTLDMKLSVASIIIFLKLQSELYQHQDLNKTSFKELLGSLAQTRERDIALALWLVGVCFGFEYFCTNYYEAIQPGFFLDF